MDRTCSTHGEKRNVFRILVGKPGMRPLGRPICRWGGRAIAQGLVAGFPPRRSGFEAGSGHVGFVVDKVALG
jgi:hypothetical protein